MRRVAALSKELDVSASELVRMLLRLPAEGAARIDARSKLLDMLCQSGVESPDWW